MESTKPCGCRRCHARGGATPRPPEAPAHRVIQPDYRAIGMAYPEGRN